MRTINITELNAILAALNNKKTIAEFLDNQEMLDEVAAEKKLIIAEVCNRDPIIRARFNDLLQQH
ncbi:hypothetical protein [Enterobacter kobei]|uniref:hypothetical protein n=1 Tax=Enterobacter kobei TaxID=208224 RepID=UPI0018C21023|nr:hypothetical protein [Enterobacter kobei]MBG0581728.1 hypothetical protein [Enterobacter kobei]